MKKKIEVRMVKYTIVWNDLGGCITLPPLKMPFKYLMLVFHNGLTLWILRNSVTRLIFHKLEFQIP